ncbi:MAG: hypothetical protein ACOYOU_20230 [Kiritimatiellia bacterium]
MPAVLHGLFLKLHISRVFNRQDAKYAKFPRRCLSAGGNIEKAAAELAGCPLGTLSRRASQGIAKLRLRLSRRGISLGSAALVGLLTSEASAAMPETRLPSILAAVKTGVATTDTATTATSTAAMLAKGAMKAMFVAKVKTAAVAVMATVIVTGCGTIIVQELAQRKQAEQPAA